MSSAATTPSTSTSMPPATPAWAATPSRSAPGWTPSASRRSSSSAGRAPWGRPGVCARGGEEALYVKGGCGSPPLGGYVKEISASRSNPVFAIGGDDAVYVNTGAVDSFTRLGGYVTQISAGLDAFG